jgi:phosphoglycerate transport regulatory protein PgtC
MKRRTFLLGASVATLALPLTRAFAQNSGHLSIVTSLPKELTDAYKTAFQKLHPEVSVDVQQRGTQAAVTYLRETASNNAADIFWASAPDAFEVLKDEGLLAPFKPNATGVADNIGDYPINDPEGYYVGFALSGAAIMWNSRYAQAKGLPAIKEWEDLTKANMLDQVAMAMPSRSGSTHLTVETILQARGWEQGWALIRAMCGNMRLITERSFGVPDGVTSGQFGYGIVLDYQALAARGAGFPVEFAYPSDTTIVPSNIAVVSKAPNEALAQQFIDFMLSEDGQKILFQPEVGRLPVRPASYANAPEGTPNPFEIEWGEKGGFKFDAQISEERYAVVDTLFDQTITFQLDVLKRVTKALHEAEAANSASNNSDATALIEDARRLIAAVPFDAEKAKSKEFHDAFKSASDTAKGVRQAELEQEWAGFARNSYEQAEAKLTEAKSKAG